MKSLFSIISLSICAIVLTFFVGTFYSYNYPMKYKEEIIALSSSYNVDSAIIASIVNVESNFREEAKSKKGAIGLMQLMPDTAEWIAKILGEEYSEEKLKNGEYNLKLGCYYVSYLNNYFGDMKLAICAYNAGQGNVSSWLSDTRYSKDKKSLDEIPFKETKYYLSKVLKNYNYYKNRYK